MLQTDSDRPAVTLVPSGASLTHAQLDELANQFAHLLASGGNPDEGGVAFLLANQLEYPVVICGARRAGFDHLPLNTHSPTNELLEVLHQFKPQFVVVAQRYLGIATQLRKQLADTRFIVVGETIEGWYNFANLMDGQPTAPITSERTGRLLLLSGGSTGTPKIVVRPNADRADTPRNGGALAFLPINEHSTLLLPAPLYHTMPVGWMIGGLESGLHVVIMQYWDEKEALNAIERYGVNFAALVPTMMGRLLDVPEVTRAEYDLGSLVAVVHGAAPCPTHVKRAFLDWLSGVEVYEAYGSSEGLGMCRINRKEWLTRPGSVGLPIQGGRVTIRNEHGTELPPGATGIVWFSRADGARMSYLGRPDDTAAVYNEHGEGSAGDTGYLDTEGYLYLQGRAKNMLIVGGVNVFPDQIADALARHPAVQDVAVTGMPHADLGEVPVALVELRAAFLGSPMLEDDLRKLCLEQLCSTALPRQFVFVESIPRLDTGKLNLRALPALVS